jgi:hypothetical protein
MAIEARRAFVTERILMPQEIGLLAVIAVGPAESQIADTESMRIAVAMSVASNACVAEPAGGEVKVVGWPTLVAKGLQEGLEAGAVARLWVAQSVIVARFVWVALSTQRRIEVAVGAAVAIESGKPGVAQTLAATRVAVSVSTACQCSDAWTADWIRVVVRCTLVAVCSSEAFVAGAIPLSVAATVPRAGMLPVAEPTDGEVVVVGQTLVTVRTSVRSVAHAGGD